MKTHLGHFTLNYADRGSGVPLLLIHGYPLNHHIWDPQIEGLDSIARIIAPDLRGFGETQAVNEAYSLDSLAEDCHKLLDELRVTTPVVVGGLSMGGYITFAFYRRYPERVRCLILVSTRAAADSVQVKANRDKAAQTAREHGVDAIVDEMLPKMLSPKTYRRQPDVVEKARKIMENASEEGIIRSLMAMKGRPDSTPILQQIEKPVLVVHGEDDQIVPIQEARSIHEAIDHSRFQAIPEAGHLVSLEQPMMVNQAVQEFLDELE